MALALVLDSDESIALYLRLSQALINAIKTGQLQAGEALPSTRVLSATLSVAPLTVHRSYQDLLSRGYLETVPGCGTFVRHRIADEAKENAGEPSVSLSAKEANIRWGSFAQGLLSATESLPEKPDLFASMFQSLPTQDQLPLAAWRKILVKNSRLVEETSLEYSGDAFGSIRLRKAIAAYLRRARAAICDWDQIAIFSGSQAALDIVCRVLLDKEHCFAMEDPGYFGARRSFLSSTAGSIAVPVDEEGISVAFLKQLQVPPNLVYVTPAHQDPTGVVLSQSRRKQLLAWAAETGALIVEDDNDCEYRHGARTLPSLLAMDEHGSVIYVNTFWRTLGSLVRIGYLVLPRRLLEVFKFVKSIVERDFPVLEQAALAEFIEDGYLERHIHKTGSLYRSRLHALEHACTVHLRGSMTLAKESGGMRVLARFDASRFSNDKIIEAACEADFPLYSTENYYMGVAPQGEFLIPFGQFDEQAIAQGVKSFAQLLSI